MLTRLFATLGSQLRFEVEPLDAHIDAEIDRLAEIPLDGRVRQSGVDLAVIDLNALRIPHVVEGAAAALLHGVPIPVAAVDIAVRWDDAEEFTTWLDRRWAPPVVRTVAGLRLPGTRSTIARSARLVAHLRWR